MHFSLILETDIAPGNPTFNLVELLNNAVKENGDRVFAAVKHSDFEFVSCFSAEGLSQTLIRLNRRCVFGVVLEFWCPLLFHLSEAIQYRSLDRSLYSV